MLGAVVLALHHDAGWLMGDAHRRIGSVDVLTAGAGGAVGVDPQVLFLNLDLNRIVDYRKHPDTGKTGVPAGRAVIGRDAYQAMDATFGFQPAIGVMAGDFKGRRFDAGLFASAFLDPLHLIAVGLAPAHIHAAHHLGPILGLGTAGAGMDFQEAVIAVGFPRQQAFDLLFLANLGQRGDVRLGLADDVAVIFHFAEFDQLQTIR